MIAPDGVRAAVEAAYRDEWGQVVATLIGLMGDWDLAEDCAQDAFAAALGSWSRDGVPRRPGAWLTTAARNRAIDRLRRDAAGAAKLRHLAVLARDADEPPVGEIPDERLRLIFTCCHPALPFPARVALTLRTLAGLSTTEIARAFLTAEPAMAQRLVRAKRKSRRLASLTGSRLPSSSRSDSPPSSPCSTWCSTEVTTRKTDVGPSRPRPSA
jgi:RNA polymerase sigma-70 factor, ECF subfamily